MTDPVEARLRDTARAFSRPGPAEGLSGAPAEGLSEVRHRSGVRRRRRRAVVTGMATVLAAVAVAGVLRLPARSATNGLDMAGGGGPAGTSAPAIPAPPEAPGTVPTGGPDTAPDSVPPPAPAEASPTTAPGPAGADPVAPPPPVTTTRPDVPRPAPLGGPVRFATDGLGVTRFGDDMATAVDALTAALGPANGPAVPGRSGTCGIRASQVQAWGNLSVEFYDKGAGLRFAAYQYGEPPSRQPAGHAAPVGPGRPALGNPWGLRIGGPVASADVLLAQVRADYPGAERPAPMAGITDTMLTVPLQQPQPGYRATIELHDMPGGGHVFERFTVWNMPDITC